MQPLVSVVIVSYNTSELTSKSIQSVYASQGFEPNQIEILLVDNNSTDDTVASISKKFPQVKLIKNQKNNGFGGGNNQGVSLAQGKYILFLNTDAFLEKDSLHILVETLEKQKDVSSVGPQYRGKDGEYQQSAGYFPTFSRVIAWMWWFDKLPLIKRFFQKPYHIYDHSWYKKPQYVDWLMGACILIHKSDFQAIGGFDENIFMYGEEVELYYRLNSKTGKKNYFTPATRVVHLGSASTQKANASRLILELRGIEYFYKKHYPHLLGFIRFIIYTGTCMRIFVFSLVPGKKEALREYKKFFTARQ